MIKDTPIFFQFYLKPGNDDAAKALLNKGGNPQLKEEFFAFSKLPTVHFSRWLYVPSSESSKSSICYSGNVNGTKEQHFKDLVATFPEELDKILNLCEGYPASKNITDKQRISFLKTHFIKTPGFYAGSPNRTPKQIHDEANLHEHVRLFVHKNRGVWKSSKEAFEAIQNHLANDPQWDWARKHYELPKKNWFMIVLLLLLVVAILPIYLLAVVLIHFFYELRAKPFGITVNELPLDHLAVLKDQEDKIYQNQLSQIFELKGGLRKLMLKFMLWLTNLAAKYFFVDGQLMGTPTIHFARWVIIDEGKRFLFFSNFDGSFDEYLGDFVDNNGWGLNAIYGASKGYPRTFFMFGQGSYKILEFMGWGRKTQIPTQIWYSAYPYYGLQQVVSKTELRVGLFNSKPLNEKKATEMLRKI